TVALKHGPDSRRPARAARAPVTVALRVRGIRGRLAGTAVVALGFVAAAHPAAWAAGAPTRYSLANGCYALQSPSGRVVAGGERLRMQATTLGSYLLYRPDATFLAAHGGG